MADQYRKLEGHSLEFGLDPEGHVSEVTGLEGVVQDPRRWRVFADGSRIFPPARDFRRRESSSARNGIRKSRFPARRFERQCGARTLPIFETKRAGPRAAGGERRRRFGVAAHGPRGGPEEGEDCAVILTQFKILQANPHGDLTPADYLHNGLRTSGVWTGSGESMNFVSLQTGLLVSATQTVDQDLNFTISSASASSSKLNYTGNVKSQSHITLLQPADKN